MIWHALIVHRNKDVNLFFPEACATIAKDLSTLLEKLSEMPTPALYEINSIVLRRINDYGRFTAEDVEQMDEDLYKHNWSNVKRLTQTDLKKCRRVRARKYSLGFL